MFRDYLAQSSLLFLPVIGLVLSFFAFTAIVVRLYVGKRRGQSFERVAALPLEDDASPPSRSVPSPWRRESTR